MTSKLTGKLVPSDDPAGVLQFIADMPKARRRKTRTTALLSEADTAPREPMLDEVERVELLVKASDAARRELPRQLRVGSSGRVVTQAEILSRLLDAEEIRAEVVSGRRPSVKRCACGVMFDIGKVGRPPARCRHCAGRVCRCGAEKERSNRVCQGCAKLPGYAEEREAEKKTVMRRTWCGMTNEQRIAGCKAAKSMSTEKHREKGRKSMAALTPEQRSENALRAQATLTPEQRSERARKANETRRAKDAAKRDAGEAIDVRATRKTRLPQSAP